MSRNLNRRPSLARGPVDLRKQTCLQRTVLPAIAAVAAISTTIAATPTATASAPTTTTVAATSAAVTPTTATTSAPASAPTAGTLGLRPGFVDHQVPSTEILTVQGVDSAVRIFVIGYFNKGEAT